MSSTPKRFGLVLGRIGVFLFCGAISAFLLLTGYESVYNRDVPFVHSLDSVNLTAYESRYDVTKFLGDDQKQIGNFGKPINLKIPQQSLRFDIVKPIEDLKHRTWLSRASSLHMMPLTAPKSGNLGTTLLYCRSSFRTITDATMPKVGDNVFIDTDRGWRYVYRVTATKSLAESEPYILSDNGKKGGLVVSCNDRAGQRNYVIEAEQLVVQGVEQ